MQNIKAFIKASRAETIFLSICPVIMGTFIAKSVGALNYTIFFLTIVYTISLHLATNLNNDYFDFLNKVDTEKRNAPFSTIQTNATSLKYVKNAFMFLFLIGALIGTYFGIFLKKSILIWLLSILPIFVGYYYTGGKKPLGYIGLGEILVFVFFGPFASFGTYYLQTNNFSILPIIAGFGPGFISTATLVINNLRDIDNDKPAKKNTLAVNLGEKFTKIEYSFLLALASLVPVIYFIITKKTLILTAVVPIFFMPIKLIYKYKSPSFLNDGLKKTSLILIIYTIIFCVFV
ncbi:MAG: 1,4-dihydroxy-2-naphthoate octaprenyltransferase [Parachlamydiales bacterium]|nr:1,4-dihydroxy-2-naphthoate octaprenyltransferase [Parachlamydiales bacterium]